MIILKQQLLNISDNAYPHNSVRDGVSNFARPPHKPAGYFYKYICQIMEGKLIYFKIEPFYYHSRISEYVQSMTQIKQWLINQMYECVNYVELCYQRIVNIQI